MGEWFSFNGAADPEGLIALEFEQAAKNNSLMLQGSRSPSVALANWVLDLERKP
jgi:hypothetical protein